jgi:DNA-directed RNA polymerase subunit RPC12/RpoP
LLLAGLGFCVVAAARADAQPGDGLAPQLVRDFRGRKLPADMTPFGASVNEFIKPEIEGLRLTLSRDRGSSAPVGLSMPLTLSGDFEITLAFEILQADEPPIGRMSYGVGLLMSVNEAARVGRLSRYKHQVATWDRWATVNGERKFLNGGKQVKGQVGRLRLNRTNTILHMGWAPELAGDKFEEVHQFEFGDKEITLLRLELNTDLAGDAGALDLRLLDLNVRATAPVTAPVADPLAAPEEVRESRSRIWFALAGGLVVAFLLALAVGLIVQFGRRRGRIPAPTAASSTEVNPEAFRASVAVACSGCGKRLKARAEQAGKKVKCPACGAAVVVPPV